MAVAVSHSGGTQLRSLEKVLEDAQVSGKLNLNGRNLRDYPKSAEKFDLLDTVEIDLSKNKLSELPCELCSYTALQRLSCYNNVIRVVPEDIINLMSLSYLNLSRNQLSVLPMQICDLFLEVLILSNNKLVSLPPEIGKLRTLMLLDASCNELDNLPNEIGEMSGLKELNIRRNHLVTLPDEISKLKLVKLDISCNKIQTIPPCFRSMKTLDTFEVDHNPLTNPPAQVCTRGRIHIFKYLSTEATRADKRRGMIEQSDWNSSRHPYNTKYRWFSAKNTSTLSLQELPPSKSSPETSPTTPSFSTSSSAFSFSTSDLAPLSSEPVFTGIDLSMQDEISLFNHKMRELKMADSGYLEGDKRWSSSEPSNEDEEAKYLAERASQQKEKRQQQKFAPDPPPRSFRPSDNHIDYIDAGEDDDGGVTPTQSPVQTPTSVELDPFTKDDELIFYEIQNPNFFEELERQKALYEEKKRVAREERLRLETEEEQRKKNGEQTHLNNERLSVNSRETTGVRRLSNESRLQKPGVISGNEERRLSASKLANGSTAATTNGNSSISTRRTISASTSASNSIGRPRSLYLDKKVPRRATVGGTDESKRASTGDRYSNVNHSVANGRVRRGVSDSDATITNQVSPERHKAQVTRRTEIEEKSRTKQAQRDAVLNYYKTRTSPTPGSRRETEAANNSKNTPSPNSSSSFSNIKPRSAFNIGGGKPTGDNIQANFTAKRERTKWAEELERIEQLRKNIESRLKVSLPEDLSEALMDGVVLCHLANNVKSHAISSIHVPSAAVPKLTQAKCRRNVDNFLKVCAAAGVPTEKLCSPADILEGKGLPKVATTVRTLLSQSAVHTKQWAV
ncbi:leucine-rich repeat and calponin homology domain-containing protein 2-like isoform X2 [Lytechinus variegatus]|uniref:leucine-rich repeat and calponin homology domain-containing protein 2-like isoform X2 n=1 Tax=Lytechinus variegatus TaxID=7654 RepID=UPI001BB17497|nr:leucine-rich repeat and calponin homology domain-containing protein 2-like isoform X2 [Lytechinus variegatus]